MGTLLLWDFGKPVIGTETDFLKKLNVKELLGEKMKEAEVKIMKAVFTGGKAYLGIIFTGYVYHFEKTYHSEIV